MKSGCANSAPVTITPSSRATETSSTPRPDGRGAPPALREIIRVLLFYSPHLVDHASAPILPQAAGLRPAPAKGFASGHHDIDPRPVLAIEP